MKLKTKHIMNKEIAKKLNDKANYIAELYSKKDREGNYNNENFKVKEAIPTSDHTATVIMEKNTGKLAAYFFYYINRGKSKGWKYFVPTDSHITGMRAFEYYKLQCERTNYKHNF